MFDELLARMQCSCYVCIYLIAYVLYQSTLKYSSLYISLLVHLHAAWCFTLATYMSGGSNWALVMLNPQHKCVSEQGSGHGDEWRWAVRHPFKGG